MKCIFYLFFALSPLFVDSQEINPNLIRGDLYKIIYNDISCENNVQLVVDPTINKFDSYELNEFGLKLDSAKYVNDNSICTKVSPYKCVSKFEIDSYKISDIYKEEKESAFPVFYGVYSPLDSWYNLIYYAAVKHFEKNKEFQFQVILPIRKVWIENKKMKEDMIFYQFWLDEKFEVLKFDKKSLNKI